MAYMILEYHHSNIACGILGKTIIHIKRTTREILKIIAYWITKFVPFVDKSFQPQLNYLANLQLFVDHTSYLNIKSSLVQTINIFLSLIVDIAKWSISFSFVINGICRKSSWSFQKNSRDMKWNGGNNTSTQCSYIIVLPSCMILSSY